MGFALAEAFVEIGANTRNFEAGLGRVKSALSGLGQHFTQLSNVAKGFLVAAGAGLGFAIDKAGDFEETVSKFEAVFKEGTPAATQWAEQFAKAVGRSKAEVMTFLSSIQAVSVAMGFDRGEAAKLSQTMTRLAVDLASFNNTTDADALEALQSGILSGESEPLKKFGIMINDDLLKKELAKLGIAKDEATDAQKAYARLQIAMRATADAQGDAERTSGSFANQMKALKGSVNDTVIELGRAFLPAVTSLVRTVRSYVPLIAQWVTQNKELIFSFVKKALVIAAVIAFAPQIVALGTIFVSVFKLMISAAAGLGQMLIWMVTSPFGLVVLGLAGIVTAFAYFIGAGDTATGRIVDGFMKIVNFLDHMFGSFQGFTQGILTLWNQIGPLLLNVWYRVENGLKNSWETLKFAFKTMFYYFAGVVADWAVQVWAAFKTLGAMIKNLWDTMIEAISNKMASFLVKRQARKDVEAVLEDKKIGQAEANYLAGTELTVEKDKQLKRQATMDVDAANPELEGADRQAAIDQKFMEMRGAFLKERASEWMKWWGGKELNSEQIDGVVERVAQDRANMLSDVQKKEKEARENAYNDRLVEIDKEMKKSQKGIKAWSEGGRDGTLDDFVNTTRENDREMNRKIAANEAERRAQLEADMAKLQGMPKLSDKLKDIYEMIKKKMGLEEIEAAIAKLKGEADKMGADAKAPPKDDLKVPGGPGDGKKKGIELTPDKIRRQGIDETFKQLTAMRLLGGKMLDPKAAAEAKAAKAREKANELLDKVVKGVNEVAKAIGLKLGFQ